MTKESFELSGHFDCTAKEAIGHVANRLLDNLFIPTLDDLQFITDGNKIMQWGMGGEPINWGDLKCCDVKKEGELYVVTIDEAAPDACPELCNYVETHLRAWGWNVIVKTEW